VANDGFYPGWSKRYDDLVAFESIVLSSLWRHGARNTRALLAQHLKEQERIEALRAKYPGEFAETVAADFVRTIECLRGRQYELTDADIAFRRLGEQRQNEIADAGRRAWAAACERHAADRIEPFPTIDPVYSDRSQVAARSWCSRP